MTATQDEAGRITQEREWWRNGWWTPAIIAFLSRALFLPLFCLRDAARTKSVAVRCVAYVVFYPSFVVAFVAYLLMGALVVVLSPLLYVLGHGLSKHLLR